MSQNAGSSSAQVQLGSSAPQLGAGPAATLVCLCPQGKSNECVHTRFLTEHGEKYFDGENADGNLVGECTAIQK